MKTLLACGLLAMVTVVQAATPVGDPARGEKLHAKCLDCHGTALYAPDRRKVTSLKGLRKEVKRWGTYYAPALSDQEVEDLVVWLDANFYHFSR